MLQKSPDPKVQSFLLKLKQSPESQWTVAAACRLLWTFDDEYFLGMPPQKSRLLSHLARGLNSQVVFGT